MKKISPSGFTPSAFWYDAARHRRQTKDGWIGGRRWNAPSRGRPSRSLFPFARRTDSTIAPPQKPAIFFNEPFLSLLLDTRKVLHEKDILTYFRFCEGLSTDDVGVEKDTVFQKIRLWAGFKTGDFVREKLGGGLPWNDSSKSDERLGRGALISFWNCYSRRPILPGADLAPEKGTMTRQWHCRGRAICLEVGCKAKRNCLVR